MQVTQIKEQVKDKSRVSVYVDEKFAFGVSKNSLLSLGISIGIELSPERLAKLKEEASDSRLVDLALHWALRRDHSEREIHDYIRRKTDDELLQQKMFESLDRSGFVNDERFTEAWVRSRRNKGYSSFQIRGELMKKGISPQLSDQYLVEEDNQAALKHLAEKKYRLNSYKDKTKLKAYLVRKGYRYSEVDSVLSELD